MNQLFTTLAFPGAMTLLLLACNPSPNCQQLNGRWSNREGQDFVFQPDGKALWLVKFGSNFDTAQFEYQIDCKKSPMAMDLKNFKVGPHVGKTLFGIIEWSSDSSFRLRYEAGIQAAERPKTFDDEQTQQFFAEQ